MTRGVRLLARGLFLALLGLALVACRAATPTATPGATAKFEPQWVGGKLQPMTDGFPRKALTIVTSETVGAGVDLFARAMAAAAEPYSPVGIKVENVATPISGIGFMIYGKEQPDGAEGYWLSTIDVSGPIRAYTKDSKGYTMKDVVVLSPGNEDRYVYVVKADAQWKDLKDLAKYAKDNPGKVRVAGAEAGGLHHMLTEMYAKEAGIKLTYVPLGASAEAYRTVLGGGAEVAAGPSSSAFGFIQKGELRALALFSDQRLPSLPDVSTT